MPSRILIYLLLSLGSITSHGCNGRRLLAVHSGETSRLPAVHVDVPAGHDLDPEVALDQKLNISGDYMNQYLPEHVQSEGSGGSGAQLNLTTTATAMNDKLEEASAGLGVDYELPKTHSPSHN